MKLLVISDTHIPGAAPELPLVLRRAAERMEGIVHAGDYTSLTTVEQLREMGPFYGVAGNMDSREVRQLLPSQLVVELAGVQVGIIHGWGPPQGLAERVLQALPKVEVLIFGHSHQPLCERRGRVLLLNPGSPTDRFYAKVNTYAVLYLGEGPPRAEIAVI